MLFFSLNLQAESNPPRHSVQFTKSSNGSTPAIDPNLPINLTATVGVAFQQELPFVKPTEGLVSLSIRGLPANGLAFADLGGGPNPGIKGIPLTAGVMSLTLLVNNGFPGMSWRPISLTVNPDPHPPIDPDPHPPINLTATVGVAFQQELPFVKPTEGLVSLSIRGLPANGLAFADLGGGPNPGIKGIPLTAGVMSLTLLVNNGFPGMSWRPISLTVNPDPHPPIDPDPHPPINLTATVGVAFQQELPFVKPTEGLVSLSIRGLPANGLAFADLGGGPNPGIKGIPLTAGVMSLTLLVNNGFPGMSWRPISLTVNPDPHPPIDPDPHPPINLTATVGVAFQQELPFVKPTEGLVSLSIRGLPANGLAFADLGGGPNPGIKGIPLTAGVMSLTLLVNNGFPGMSWRPISLTVNPDPHPPIDPDPHPPINLTATVGVAFQQELPFVKPTEGLVSLSIRGLPANGLAFADLGGGPNPGIKGIPLTAGVMSLTLLVNNGFPGMSWRPISLTINSGPGSALTLLAPTYNCTTGAFHFNTSGGDGSPITFFAIGITDLTTNPDQFVDSELRTVADAQPIHLQATQNGVTVTYVWDIRAQCPVGLPPMTSTFSITGVTTVSCATVTVGERRLTFTPQYTGVTGQPVSFSVVNEMTPTTSPGPYTLRLYTDNPTITLKAIQTGSPGEASFTYNWLAVCGGGSPPPPPTGTFSITGVTTVSCATVTAGERRLTFTPRYAGLNGQPVSFSVVNEMLPTISPGPYTLRLYTDNPTITLMATQTGTPSAASFSYNWLAVCSGGGAPRLGVSPEPTAELQVKLLGNPVRAAVEVEVRGGANRPLHLSLTDMMGRVVGESRTERASASEKYRFDVSTLPSGTLLLRTSTQGQTKVVRVLKTE